MSEHTHFRISEPEKAGKWVICERLNIYTTKKPSWLHIKMAKLLLGWEYIKEITE